MKKNKSFLVGLVIFVITALIPVSYIVYCKINSYIVSWAEVLFLLIPVVLSALFVFIRKIPGVLKIVLPALMLVASVLGFGWMNGIGGHEEFRAFHNENEIIAYDSDFDFSEYGEFKNISYYKYHSTGLFQQEAYTTILKYDEENFAKEKKKIESNSEFYSEPFEEGEAVPVFTYMGFNFRVEKNEITDEWYPHELHFTGINEESCEIVYVSFTDHDLDTVSDFGKLLYGYCGWYLIEKEIN